MRPSEEDDGYAFSHIAACIESIESNGGHVRTISPVGESFFTDGTLCAKFAVDVPQLSELPASELALESDCLTVADDGTCVLEFTVSVPLTEQDETDDEASTGASNDEGSEATGESASTDNAPSAGSETEHGQQTATDGSPEEPTEQSDDSAATADADKPYQNPERLQAVYEEYDTFKEMRDALGVDVTPQTVRRHMIDHGIHEVSSNPTLDLLREQGDRRNNGSSGSGEGSESDGTPVPDTPDAEVDPQDDQTSDDDQDTPALDGLDLPPGLTIADVKNAVKTSRTVREVQHQLELSESDTRALLSDLNLLSLVIGRLNTNEAREIPDAELDERIRGAKPGQN